MKLDYVSPIKIYTIEEFIEEVKLAMFDISTHDPLRNHYSYPNITLKYMWGQWIATREDTEDSKMSFKEEEILNYILEHVKKEAGKIVIRLAEVMDGMKY